LQQICGIILPFNGNGIAWKGLWKSGEEYHRHDAVLHDKISYICLQDHISSASESPSAASDLWDIFALNTCLITATSGNNGNINPAGDIGVSIGASQMFTMNPDAGYAVLDVLTDGESTGAVSTYTFTDITADHEIHVIFKQGEQADQYTITATSGSNGSINPAGEVAVNKGESKIFIMNPDPGYEVKDVLVDGISVGAENFYSLTNITADHEIHVTFKERVEGELSIITCELSENSIIIGEPFQISGRITPDLSQFGVFVDVALILPGSDEIHTPVLANVSGEFTYDSGCRDIFRTGTWTVQTSWSGDEGLQSDISEEHILKVEKAESRVTLDVTSQAIRLGEEVSISGKFTPQPYCGKVLPDTRIKLNFSDPDGERREEVLNTDQWGLFKLGYYTGFDKLGDWTVRAVFTENEAYEGSESEILQVSVVETAGYAIIIQGKASSGEGIESHSKTSNFVYKTLGNRGIPDDDIMYFNYDETQTSEADNIIIAVDAVPSKVRIEEAITVWAGDKMNSDTGKPANLYIVMVDHGLSDRFSIYPDTITSADLANWLNTLQGSLTGQAATQEIVIILGFCHSGSFIEELAGDHRVIIASAAPDEFSYKGPLDEDSIRDGEYFISEFFRGVSYGKSVRESFQEAVRLTEIFTSSGTGDFGNAPYFDDSLQHPLLEDDGKEPFGSNDLSDPAGDGLLSGDIFVGVSSITANEPGDVVIEAVAGHQFLKAEDDSADLWAVVNDFDRTRTVWCEVKPPDYAMPNPADTDNSEQAEMNLEKTLYISADKSKNLFEWTDLGSEPDHPDFSTPGTYQVFFFAKDDITGNVSPLAETRVYKNRPSNRPPDPFSSVSPADASDSEETVSTTPLLDWEDAADPDGDRLSYTVVLSKGDASFDDPIYKEGLEKSVCVLLPSDGMADGSIYYWKVRATDEYGAVQETDVRAFRTDNYNNPLDGWIEGHVYDASTGKPVDTFGVVVGDETLRAASKGYYIGEKSPSKYDVMVEADGYVPNKAEVVITEEKVVTHDFDLNPDINGNHKVDLADAILALKLLTQTEPIPDVCKEADTDEDGEIGLAEVIFVLQKLTE